MTKMFYNMLPFPFLFVLMSKVLLFWFKTIKGKYTLAFFAFGFGKVKKSF